MRILLVEDDIDDAASIAEYLEFHTIGVDFAYSVQQAKSLLAQDTFDLIVMDNNLPDGTGTDLCRQLKQSYNIKQPILFLTANGQLDNKLQAFDSGAVDYMVKPFSMQELHARIKALNAHINSQEQFELNVGQLSVCIKTGSAHFDGQPVQLHRIGLTILAALMRSHPKPLSSEHLCNLVWPDEIPKSNPLKANISRINAQFNELLPGRLITSIRGIGYQLTLEVDND